ncbi:interleukin 2 receptor, gamma a [Chanos chanos]|uniref:Interleukin 2 receptor, gamma a n=1 Tax=Chanos chanos TaxID=29144 RepID=A0A6J2WW13_CHACN|nr:cytokine receptor common subunit gamma-like [Chanos chanos]
MHVNPHTQIDAQLLNLQTGTRKMKPLHAWGLRSVGMLLVPFLLVIFLQGCASTSSTNLSCYIVNLEYVNCTWRAEGIKGEDYTFKSGLENKPPQKCPRYLQEEGVNVGCIEVCSDQCLTFRFNTFHTILSTKNGRKNFSKNFDLRPLVKLNPPTNVTVEMMQEPELRVYWNSSVKFACVESQIRFKVDNKESYEGREPKQSSLFTVPFPSTKSRYEFQVRQRMASACGESTLWSEWSEPAIWNPAERDEENNFTEINMSVWLVCLGLAALILVILSCLLVHSERLKYIFIPVVPRPDKNLMELFDNYDGHEKWLCIPQELEEGFKPHFTERPCSVCEYQLLHPSSSSESDSALSIPTDQTDYVFLSSYSSASTLPVSVENATSQTSTSSTVA